jgi:hypothetical protein
MEQSRIEESVSVSPSSVDIFVLFRLGLSLTFFSSSPQNSFNVSLMPSFFPILRARTTSPETGWVDGRLRRKSH